MNFSGRTVVGIDLTINSKDEHPDKISPHAKITRDSEGRETFGVSAYSAEELNSINTMDTQESKRSAIKDILDKYHKDHPNRAQAVGVYEGSNAVNMTNSTSVESNAERTLREMFENKGNTAQAVKTGKVESDAERTLREMFGNRGNTAQAVKGGKAEAFGIDFTGGSPSDESLKWAEEARKTILADFDVVVEGEVLKGACVSPYDYGILDDKIILRLRIEEGYGIYPKEKGDCIIERRSNGSVRVKNYYGLDKDIPQKSIKEMSNDQFVEYLYQIGLPRGALISREDFN